jgi:hypothetical protein
MNSLASPMHTETSVTWDSGIFPSSSQELFPLRVNGSKTLARIKAVFGKFAMFTVSALEE